MLIAVSQAQAGDLPGRLPGMWYLDYYSYDATGFATTSTHLISGHVHTHPPGPDQAKASPDYDIPFAGGNNKPESYPGVSKYILNNDGIVPYDKNGAKTKQPLNCN